MFILNISVPVGASWSLQFAMHLYNITYVKIKDFNGDAFKNILFW